MQYLCIAWSILCYILASNSHQDFFVINPAKRTCFVFFNQWNIVVVIRNCKATGRKKNTSLKNKCVINYIKGKNEPENTAAVI